MSQDSGQNPKKADQVRSLRRADWDVVESMIKEALDRHMRTYEDFDYFIVNDRLVIVKVYTRKGMPPAYTVKMHLWGGKLVVTEVDGVQAII